MRKLQYRNARRKDGAVPHNFSSRRMTYRNVIFARKSLFLLGIFERCVSRIARRTAVGLATLAAVAFVT
ncbi:MAG TPA: hypothetical protein VGI48_14445, partial [Caldimonas sp.]